MSSFTPKKVGYMRYQIDADSSKGMKVPVTILPMKSCWQK